MIPERSGDDPKEKSVVRQEAQYWPPITLRNKLIKIGAKIMRHGRIVTLQLAEVTIPRALFAEILRLIAWLRPASLQPTRA